MDHTLNHAPCCYFVFDDSGNLLQVNQTLCDVLGYTKEELENAKTNDVFTVSMRIFFQTHWFPLLQFQQTVNELHVTLLGRNKATVPLLVNSRRIHLQGQEAIECAGIRINNREKYEEELIATKKAYEAALANNTALVRSRQKLEEQTVALNNAMHILRLHNQELGQINKVMTHDMQEPIRKLLFYSQQWMDETSELSSTGHDRLARIHALAERLRKIVSGLQEFIWITEVDKPHVPVDLNSIVDRTARAIGEKYPQVTLTVATEALPLVNGVVEQLYSMMWHLIDNAVRFRKDAEAVTVRITAQILQQNSLSELRERYRYTDFVRLAVADNGRGFETHLSDQVFQLLYKGPGSEGAGLGLALAKKIAERHEGTLTAESQPERGTTILITLPLSDMQP